MLSAQSFIDQPLVQTLIILVVAILIERVLPWPDKYHPLSLFRLLAIKMSDKVNPDQSRSAYQRKISGSLAAIALLTPILSLTIFFVYLADFRQFFDLFLLLVALQFSSVITRFHKITRYIKANKKALARDTLSSLVLRETSTLSPMGIAKAAIEALLLRFHYQYCAVIFWYLIAGSTAALTYRLIFELSQIWNIKLAKFVHFGRPVATIQRLIVYVPLGITVIAFALAERFLSGVSASRQLPKGSSSHAKVLARMGGALQIQLGGPVFYEGKKQRLPKVGSTRQVKFADLSRSLFALYKCFAVLFVFTLLVCAISFAIRHSAL